MAVLAAVSVAAPTLLAAAPAAAAEASPPALSVPEPAADPGDLEPSTEEGEASAGDPPSPGAAESSQTPVAPEAGTRPAEPSPSGPVEPTQGPPVPEQSDVPTTAPGAPAAGGEAAPGSDTTPGGETSTGSRTTTASPAAVPRRAPKQTSTEQTVNRDHPTVSVTLDKALHATVLGLPVKFTPGSGWHDFTLRLANVSHRGITSVAIYIDMDLHTWTKLDDTRSLLTAQWYDKDAGAWKDMLDDGYLSYCFEPHLTDLAPGEYVDTQLRLQVDARMPDSYGAVRTHGGFEDEDGAWHNGLLSSNWFEIVAAGNKPPAKSKPAHGNKPASHGNLKELPTTGKPAATSTGKPAAAGTGKPAAAGTGGGEIRPVGGRSAAADDSADRAGSDATLAETGSDAASGWILGVGGASITLGTALAAAARRRHRHAS